VSTSTRYATPAEFVRRALRGETLTADEELTIGAILDTVSRCVDHHCRRQFYASAASTARYLTALRTTRLVIDDLTTLVSIGTDEDGDGTYEHTWGATDYNLEPFNAAELSRPYTSIAVAPRGIYAFPAGVAKGCKITGTWGFPTVPPEVKEATIIEAAGLWQQGKGIGGLVGGGEQGAAGQSVIQHPRAIALLSPFRRVRVTS